MKTYYQHLSRSVNSPTSSSEYQYRKVSSNYNSLSSSRYIPPQYPKPVITQNPLNLTPRSHSQLNPEDYLQSIKKTPSKYSSLRQTIDTSGNTKIKSIINKSNNPSYLNSSQSNLISNHSNIYQQNKCHHHKINQKYQNVISTFENYLQNLKQMKIQIKKIKQGKKQKKLLLFNNKNYEPNQQYTKFSFSNRQTSHSDYKFQLQQTPPKNTYKYNDEIQNFKKRKPPIGMTPMTPSTELIQKKFNTHQKQRENNSTYLHQSPSYNQCKLTFTTSSSPSKYHTNKYNQYSQYQYATLPSTTLYNDNHVKNSPKYKQKYHKQQKSQTQINHFLIGKIIGEGKFGVVYQAIHQPTGWIFAIKKVSKNLIKTHEMIDQFILQLKLQTYLNHSNILTLYTQFDDKDYLYLVLEYMQQGTLFNYLKKYKKLSQGQVAIKINQIASAAKYLHQNQIAHRDIKPENIVMSHGVCKLCDFGWATICSERRKTYCGTFDYAPPQILQGIQYDYTVDLWCLGVLTYQLLVGKAPFYHISRKQTMKKILNVPTQQPQVQKTTIQFPQTISKPAINFIDNLLKKDPKQRINSDMLLQHPFLKYLNKNGIYQH